MKDIREYKEVSFSLDDGDMKKSKLYEQQREKKGWDDTETFALDVTFARFIIPRLKKLLELKQEYILMKEDEIQAIKDMISGFEIAANDEIETKNYHLVQRALFLFGAWFHKLGW